MSHLNTAYQLGAYTALEKFAEWEKTALVPAAGAVGAAGGAIPGAQNILNQIEEEVGRPLTADDATKVMEAIQSGELNAGDIGAAGKSMVPGAAGGALGVGLGAAGGYGIAHGLSPKVPTMAQQALPHNAPARGLKEILKPVMRRGGPTKLKMLAAGLGAAGLGAAGAFGADHAFGGDDPDTQAISDAIHEQSTMDQLKGKLGL